MTRRFHTRTFGPRPAGGARALKPVSAEAAWRGMIAACRALREGGDQPGLRTALTEARGPCLGAPAPAEGAGEGLRDASDALLRLAQTLHRAPDIGWRIAALNAVADEVEAAMDRADAARMARMRASFGGE